MATTSRSPEVGRRRSPQSYVVIHHIELGALCELLSRHRSFSYVRRLSPRSIASFALPRLSRTSSFRYLLQSPSRIINQTYTRTINPSFLLLPIRHLIPMADSYDFSPLHVGASIVAATIISAAIKTTWRLYMAPLARSNIPGPTIAAASDVWFDYQALRRNRVWAICGLFQVRTLVNYILSLTEPFSDIWSYCTHRSGPRRCRRSCFHS